MDAATETRERLLKEDPQFQRLARKHREYEARLAELQAKRYPTEEEQREEAQLKKLKLSIKDEMERILRTSRG